MKILIVGPLTSPIIQRLMQHLKKIGHEVLLASHDAVNSDDIVDLGKLTSFLGYLNFFKINKIVRDFKPDIVHAHVLNHYGLMSIMQPKPLVVALWGSDILVAPHVGSYLRRSIYRVLNWMVLKRASRCHTSGIHVAEEAGTYFRCLKNKVDVFYWGFPIESSEQYTSSNANVAMKNEFGITGDGLVVFPRGLGSVYNPSGAALIINKLLETTNLGKKIVVLKGFANDADEIAFKSMVNLNDITYVDRLLSSDELFCLYEKTKIHFSIPTSDSLGGGVIEPALFGSFPILSNLPSYRNYLENNHGLIMQDYEDGTVSNICEKIIKLEIGKSVENIPKAFTTTSVLNNLNLTYLKAKG